MISHEPLWLLPLLLYAETHYRFKYFFSLLKKNEPEILADAPHRIDPGVKIPILILVKDADQYPCRLLNVSATVAPEGMTVQTISILTMAKELNRHWWWRVFFLDPPSTSGWIDIDVTFTISDGRRTRSYKNDNYRTSSHRSLRVYVSKDPLPRIEGLHYGDCHTHSTYTEDQVEYGSPVDASATLASALGLSFFCVADHSYDLDDHEDDYLANDPLFRKWNRLSQETIARNRARGSCIPIQGEEVSSRNMQSRNVHFLLLGNQLFFRGSGDSAEQWLRTTSEHSVDDIMKSAGHGLGFAAHPQEHVPFLQKILLRRGRWEWKDITVPGLCGIQFLNGTTDAGFQRGKALWIRGLLAGMQLYAIAGNDAHGNFNRFRQIGLPFLHIRETSSQLFGNMKTGVFIKGNPTTPKILRGIRSGCSIITDGPAAFLQLRADDGRTLGQMGDVCITKTARAEMHVVSSTEYGAIESIKLFCGTITASEELLFEVNPRNFEWSGSVKINPRAHIYMRFEAQTSKSNKDGLSHFCLTNPIWLLPPGGKQKSPSLKGLSRRYNSLIAGAR